MQAAATMKHKLGHHTWAQRPPKPPVIKPNYTKRTNNPQIIKWLNPKQPPIPNQNQIVDQIKKAGSIIFLFHF
jgi:hypothetical protein